jgi:ABC-type multidrug transport system permease subunit
MNKMRLDRQILIVNTAILAGLGFQYFRGAPVFAIAISAVCLLLLVNVIFFVRVRRAKKAP